MEIPINRNPKKKPKEILKSTIAKTKHSLEGFKGRFEQAEERISELEDETMELRLRNRKKRD